MTNVQFTIPGKPVGKGRPKFARRGKFVTTYTPEQTVSFENLVKLQAAKAMEGKDLIEGPVAVRLKISITPPTSWSEKKRLRALNGEVLPTVKPDVDNVQKAIYDACNGIVWHDDKQVCDVVLIRRYAATSETAVLVSEKAGVQA